MKIERIRAKSFRTLVDMDVHFPAYYGTISGRNNAGKTNLVLIIRDFLQEDERGFPFRIRRDNYSHFCSKLAPPGNPVWIAVDLSLDRKDDAEVFFLVDSLRV